MPLIKGLPDEAVYVGGGLGAAGLYMFVRRWRAAKSPSTNTPSNAGSNPIDISDSEINRTLSMVPYYLGPSQSPPMEAPPEPVRVGRPRQVTVPPAIPPPAPAAPPAPAPVAGSPPPAPAPPPKAQIPLADWIVQKMTAGGEHVVKYINDQWGSGGWYVTNLGGVYNTGNSADLGTAYNLRNAGNFSAGGREIVDVQPYGKGFQAVSNRGEWYTLVP